MTAAPAINKVVLSARKTRLLLRGSWEPWKISRAIRIARESRKRGSIQFLSEFSSLLLLVMQLKPRTIVEIGTHEGGSLWGLCQVAPSDAMLVTIDMPGGAFGEFEGDSAVAKLRHFARGGQTVEVIVGNSHLPETREELSRVLNGRKVDFLFIDGDHSYEGVSSDFEDFAPFVSEGGMIAFHDIVPGDVGNVGGVPEFWQEVKSGDAVELVKDWHQGGCGIGLLRRSEGEGKH